MESDVLFIYLIVGIVLILIVVGILIWAVVSIFQNNRKGKDQTTKEEHGRRSDQTNELIDGPSGKSRSPGLATPLEFQTKDTELLRIYRNINTGSLYIEVDGKHYHKLSDIRDPQTGRLLLQTVADLNRFTRGVTPAIETKTPAASNEQSSRTSLLQPKEIQGEASAPRPGSLAQRGEALINSAHPTKVEPGTIPPPPSSLLQRAYKVPDATSAKSQNKESEPVPSNQLTGTPLGTSKSGSKVSMGAFWGRVLTPQNKGAAVTGPRPLADELEDILTGLLDGMPEPAAQEIHFRTAADGRLVIEVDNASYEDVGAIQDPAARQIIRAVIKKWEKK